MSGKAVKLRGESGEGEEVKVEKRIKEEGEHYDEKKRKKDIWRKKPKMRGIKIEEEKRRKGREKRKTGHNRTGSDERTEGQKSGRRERGGR